MFGIVLFHVYIENTLKTKKKNQKNPQTQNSTKQKKTKQENTHQPKNQVYKTK